MKHLEITGWWFGTCFMMFYDFPYIWNFIIPTDELIFFKGVETTNQIKYSIAVLNYRRVCCKSIASPWSLAVLWSMGLCHCMWMAHRRACPANQPNIRWKSYPIFLCWCTLHHFQISSVAQRVRHPVFQSWYTGWGFLQNGVSPKINLFRS